MLNKKGQVVIEWLMTYGWAIIVVVVAIIGLIYFGIFSSDNFIPFCTCSQINLSWEKSATINGIVYKQCSKTESKFIIKNNSIVKKINYTKQVFICDKSERVLIPYEYYLKALELENA